MTRAGARPSAEGGFTLIELLVTVTILGIVMSAIVTSLLVMLQTKKSTLEQLDVSHDAQNAASFFNNDAQGATRPVAFSTAAGCGSTATALIRFTGNDYDPGSLSPVVLTTSWYWDAASRELRRISCRGAAVATTAVMAHDLKAAPTAGASCDGASPALPDAPVVSLALVGTDDLSFVLCAQRRAS